MTVVGIGEVLWDLLPDGPTLGGAPFNVIAHLAQLGYDAAMISAIGADALGESALALAVELGVDTQFIATTRRPTGVARVQIDSTGAPRFRVVSPAAWQSVHLRTAELDEIVSFLPRALVFGTLAQQSASVRSATERISRAIPGAIRVYDTNLRANRWSGALVVELLRLATVAKLNEAELQRLAPLLGTPTSARGFAEAVASRFELTAVCVTRGEHGAFLWVEGEYFESDAVETRVVDTIGAGDAFTAVLIDGLLRRAEPPTILRQANDYAGIRRVALGSHPATATPVRAGFVVMSAAVCRVAVSSSTRALTCRGHANLARGVT